MSVNGTGLDVTGHHMFPPPPEDEERSERVPLPRRTVYNDLTRNSTAREVVDELGVNRRLITFHVQYDNDMFELQLVDTETVGMYFLSFCVLRLTVFIFHTSILQLLIYLYCHFILPFFSF